MSVVAKMKLVLPHCRFCGREWQPAEYVSANHAFCEECRDERLAITQARVVGIQVVRGRNGERALIPVKRRSTT